MTTPTCLPSSHLEDRLCAQENEIKIAHLETRLCAQENEIRHLREINEGQTQLLGEAMDKLPKRARLDSVDVHVKDLEGKVDEANMNVVEMKQKLDDLDDHVRDGIEGIHAKLKDINQHTNTLICRQQILCQQAACIERLERDNKDLLYWQLNSINQDFLTKQEADYIFKLSQARKPIYAQEEVTKEVATIVKLSQARKPICAQAEQTLCTPSSPATIDPSLAF